MAEGMQKGYGENSQRLANEIERFVKNSKEVKL